MAKRKTVTGALKHMVDAYIECMLWSSVDDNDTPLDDNFGPRDLTVASYNRAVTDCADFLALAADAGIPVEQTAWEVGHDLWLTRNGHGAGFWDRGLKHGTALSKIAKSFGSIDPMPSRGKIHAE
jgi:hypothetical protein